MAGKYSLLTLTLTLTLMSLASGESPSWVRCSILVMDTCGTTPREVRRACDGSNVNETTSPPARGMGDGYHLADGLGLVAGANGAEPLTVCVVQCTYECLTLDTTFDCLDEKIKGRGQDCRLLPLCESNISSEDRCRRYGSSFLISWIGGVRA